MIEVKDAVRIAKSHAVDILGAVETGLEEIERETYNKRDVWAVTLSIPRGVVERIKNPLARTGDPLELKRFLIDSETGEFVAMKLRELASR